MKPMDTTLNHILQQTRELEPIGTYRLGTIVKLEPNTNQVWIDYEGNPLAKPLPARLGTAWIGYDELNQFKDKIDSVKIEFLDRHPAKPIIRDIFFSVNAMNRSTLNRFTNKVLEIEADEIILKGNKQITIQSGDAKTVYKAKGAEIVQEANLIVSSADKDHKIHGGTVRIN